MPRQMDCPNDPNHRTFFQPGTAYERWCGDCHAVWDIRDVEEIESE